MDHELQDVGGDSPG